MNALFIDYIESFIPKENIFVEEPMKDHTTFKIGGPAEVLVKVQNIEQLSKLLVYLGKLETPYFLLGNGSNLLVSDGGYRGIVVQLDGSMCDIEVCENRIVAGAGATLAAVAKKAYAAELCGFEFAAGIPGTVGGAIVMNAGAYGGEMSQIVTKVRVMNRDGEIMIIVRDFMKFGYRTSIVKNHSLIVLDVTYELEHGDKEEIRAKMQELSVRRKEKQPLELPSAGSTFKRPEGHFAGKLIMDSGLSGYRIGDAVVSPKHNGFIVNEGNATASDVSRLIAHIQNEVECKQGVRLEPEVICLGNFN